MMAQEADDDTAVTEILALLCDLPILTAVTIQGPDTHGGIYIMVRKAGQQWERCMQYRYSWEARVGANGHAWERTGGVAYETAAAAYQAAVEAVQAALPNQWTGDVQAAD